MMRLGVGLKWGAIAAIVSVVGWTLYSGTQSIREAERDKVTIELQNKQIKKLEKANEAAGNPSNFSTNPERDAADVLQQWELRQSNR